MLNKAIGFFVKQKNKIVNIFYTDPQVSIQPIKELFYNFQITEALNSLEKLIDSSDRSNIKNMFELYLVKAEFFLKLQKIDEFKSLMNYIEKNYKKLIDSGNKKYDSLKLTYLSFEKDEDRYFNLAEKMSMHNQKKDLNFYRIVYYINTNDADKIIELLKDQNYNPKEINSDLALILGHSYNFLIHTTQKLETNFELMLQYYNNYENNTNHKNKVDLLSTYMTKCVSAIFTYYQFLAKLSKSDEEIVLNAINYIEPILEEINNFGNNYQEIVINNLASYYTILNDQTKFKNLFQKYTNIMNEQSYITYYIFLDTNIKKDEIYKIYQEKHFPNFLVTYLEHLYRENNTQLVVSFIYEKQLLSLSDYRIECFYDLSKVDLDLDVEEILNKYEAIKEDDLLNTVIYLKASKKLNKSVENDFLNNLHTNLTESKELSDYFFKILFKLLFNLDTKYTFNLVNKINKTYPYLTPYILELSSKSLTVKLNDIESFITNISLDEILDNFQFNVLIGNIYNSYFNSFKTYQYYLKAWEEHHDIELAKRILDLMIRMKNLNIMLDDNEVFFKVYSYLKVNDAFNDIEIALLGAYYHFQNKEFKEGSIFFNKKILNSNVEELESDILNIIGSLYFKSIIDTKDDMDFNKIDENMLVIENPLIRMKFSKESNNFISFLKPFNQVLWVNSHKNKKYSIHNIYKKISKDSSFSKYSFEYKSNIQMKAFNMYYEKLSLFHFLANQLIHKAKNVLMVETNLGKENQFETMFNMIKEASEHDQNILNNYMQGEFVPLYSLAKSNYENLAPLMLRELMDNTKNTFFSGNNNPNKKAKKLISISSLILLKYLGHLETVLSLENVYVQSTVINWIELTKEAIRHDKTKMSMSYKDGVFYRHEMTEIEREGLVKVYEEIYEILLKKSVKNNRVVDDYIFCLPYKLSAEILNYIGHLDCFAMAFCINNNYQLITEDISLTKIYQMMSFNEYFISNMTSLLMEVLSLDNFIDLAFELNKLSYKNTLNNSHLEYIEKVIYDVNFQFIENKKIKTIIGKTTYILNDLGWLEEIKNLYRQEYMLKDIKGSSVLFNNIGHLLNLMSEANYEEKYI